MSHLGMPLALAAADSMEKRTQANRIEGTHSMCHLPCGGTEWQLWVSTEFKIYHLQQQQQRPHSHRPATPLGPRVSTSQFRPLTSSALASQDESRCYDDEADACVSCETSIAWTVEDSWLMAVELATCLSAS